MVTVAVKDLSAVDRVPRQTPIPVGGDGPGVSPPENLFARSAPRSRLLLVIAAITITGGLLRFATLSQGVWFDEAVTVRDISGNFAHLWASVAHHEVSPPLYFVLLWLWRAVFGASTVALRTMSAVAGTLTIPVAFAAANRLVGRRVAVIVGLLAACSPVLLYYSQELRPYALLVLLCSLGVLAFVSMLDAPGRPRLALWAAVSSLALATHYFAALAVLPQAAMLLVNAWRGRALRLPTAFRSGSPDPFSPPPACCCSTSTNAATGSASARSALRSYPYASTPTLRRAATAAAWLKSCWLVRAARGTCDGTTHARVPPLGPGEHSRQPRGRERRRAELALLLFLPGIAAAVTFQALDIPYEGRYLLVLWLPLTVVMGCGFGMTRTRVARVAATSIFCALSLVIGIAAATVPRFSGREDTRSPAQSLGLAGSPRLIAIDQSWDVLPFALYRPYAHAYRRASATVSELDVVAMPARGFPAGTDADRPRAPRLSALPSEMALRQIIRGATYVIERYTAGAPVTLWLSPSGELFSADWRFLYEPAGARAGGS